MTVKKLIELLKEQSEDAEVIFYDWLKGDDMYFKEISISEDNTEIYFNITT